MSDKDELISDIKHAIQVYSAITFPRRVGKQQMTKILKTLAAAKLAIEQRESSEWIPVAWERQCDLDNFKSLSVSIELLVSPFYEGERFAVRHAGRCLTIKGEWEYEPMPSSRDEAFYERCRFLSFEAAQSAIKELTDE